MSVRLVSDPLQHPLISTGSAVHGSLRLNRPARPSPAETQLLCDANGHLYCTKRTAFDPSRKATAQSSAFDWKREADSLLAADASLDASLSMAGSAKRIANRLINSQYKEIQHHQNILNAQTEFDSSFLTTQRAAQATAVLPQFSPYKTQGKAKSKSKTANNGNSEANQNANSTGQSSTTGAKISMPGHALALRVEEEKSAAPSTGLNRLPISDWPTTASDYGCYYDSNGNSASNDRFLGSLVNSKELWPTFDRTSRRTGIGGNRLYGRGSSSSASDAADWKSLHQKDFIPPREMKQRLDDAMQNPQLKNKELIDSTAGSLGFGPRNPHYRAYLAKGIDTLVK